MMKPLKIGKVKMNYSSYHIVFNELQVAYFTEPIIPEECILEVAETIATEKLEFDKTFDTVKQAVFFLNDQYFFLIPLKLSQLDVFMDYVHL